MNGEAVVFWIVAPIAVAAAIGLVTVRKAVHGALFVAVTMICLAILYIAQDAPFLGVVQVVVYTGAVMMLFLFVIMLVGVDASDSRVETIKGQRFAAVLLGTGLGLLLVTVLVRVSLPDPVGLEAASPEGNVIAISERIFVRYVFAFELTSALIITAAVGAMVLSHQERFTRKLTQRELSEQRLDPDNLAAMAPLPPPGVYARHNAVDTPALLPDGSASALSLSRVLVARDAVLEAPETAEVVARMDGQELPPPRIAASTKTQGEDA